MNSESDLSAKHCKPCEGGVDALNAERAGILVSQVPGWELSEDGNSIHRRFRFSDFYQTMAFVNAMAWIANTEDHHPDFSAGYNYCDVAYTTHALGGLSENDFICAAQINALIED